MHTPRWLQTCSVLPFLLAVGLTGAQAQTPPLLVLTVDRATPDGSVGRTSLESLNARGTQGGNFIEGGGAFLVTNTGVVTEVRCRGAAGDPTVILDVNDHGEAAGWCVTNGEEVGFLRFSSGRLQILRFPGARETRVQGFNDHREAVGTFTHLDTGIEGWWFWRGGRFETIPLVPTGLTNRRQILGFRFEASSGRLRGLLRERNGTETALDYPGATHTIPLDRNEVGVTVGIFENTDTGVHAFVLDEHGWRPFTLTHPGALFVQPNAINDKGQIAGRFAIPQEPPAPADLPYYFLGFVTSAVPVPLHVGVALASRQETDAEAAASFARMASAADAPAVATNTFTLQRSDVACGKASPVSAKVQGWQICEQE